MMTVMAVEQERSTIVAPKKRPILDRKTCNIQPVTLSRTAVEWRISDGGVSSGFRTQAQSGVSNILSHCCTGV